GGSGRIPHRESPTICGHSRDQRLAFAAVRPSLRLVAGLLWGSGFCALFYQTAWQRMFRLVFGASTAASAAVLAVFLGGLGVGGLVIGARAERHDRPLYLYGNLELGVALAAAVSPLLT